MWRAVALPFDVEYLADDGPLEQAMRFTRVPCSGPCCGNPRRHFGERTPQERRADADLQAEFATWDQLSDEALLNVEQLASARVHV